MNIGNIISQIMYRAKMIAIYGSPVDTGNLRHNAISARVLDDGGVVKFSARKAYYFRYLDEGKGWTDRHRGFLSRIESDITTMVLEFFNEGKEDTYSRYRSMSRGLARKFTPEQLDQRHYRAIQSGKRYSMKE